MLVNLLDLKRSLSLLEHGGGVVNAQIGYAAGNCPDRQTAISKITSEDHLCTGQGKGPGTLAKLRLFFAIPRFYETSGSEYFTSIC